MRAAALVGAVICILLTIQLVALRAEPGKETEAETIARLIQQLGDDVFAKREAASKALDAIGKPALGPLRKAAASSGDAEIRLRARRLVQGIAGRLRAVAAEKEIAALQGAWYSTSTEEAGRRQSGEEKSARHIITANRWVNKIGDTVVQAGTLNVVEISHKQVKADFIVTEGLRKGDTWLAIYERNGDVLKWCGGYIGQRLARPTTFTTRPGDGGYFLRSLKREKK
jgi:uncharacterized protein (TIGR03067 family)